MEKLPLDFCGPVSIPFTYFEDQNLEKSVFTRFTEISERYAHKIAIKNGNLTFTYQEVNQWAITIALAVDSYVKSGEPVGIALPNDVFFPIAMLACLALGCPYVALDINAPAARNDLIMKHSGVRTIINMSDIDLPSSFFNYIYIDKLELNRTQTFVAKAKPDDIAYIIYTSGSTGIPKGVYQNQRNLLHDVMQYTNSVHLSDKDHLSLFYSPGVGGAIRDIYGSLLNGATLSIKNLADAGIYDLQEFIRKEQITIYHSIPNIFRTFLSLNPNVESLSTVRLVYLAGDRIFNTDVELYQKFFSEKCLLYVGIGSTEVATIYRQWFLNKSTDVQQERIPLGYGVPDKEMFLINENNEVCNEGEIIIRSKYISLGYWKDKEQTEKSFTIDDDTRIFRTGDIGRLNADGALEFVGRKDNQIKINGYRVELSEIEGALMNHSSIKRCAVILAKADTIFAFFESDYIVHDLDLKRWLSGVLPVYMVPFKCIQVDKIPILHNFKTDYTAVRHLAQQIIENNALKNRNSEESGLYEILRETWGTFLDQTSFDKNIAWKDAGGSSLNAVNFLVQLETNLGVNLDTDWIHGGMRPLEVYDYLNHLNIRSKPSKNKIIYYFPPIIGMTPESREFLNELSHHVRIRIVNYPDFASLPLNENGWNMIYHFMAEQLTDAPEDTGLLSSCTGGIMINNLMMNTPVSSYKLIGLIDGELLNKKMPVNINFTERLISFFKVGKLSMRIFHYIYTRNIAFQGLMNFFHKHKLIELDKLNIVNYLFRQYQSNHLNKRIIYFKTENRIATQEVRAKENLNGNGEIVLLKGKHDNVFNQDNTKVILSKLLEKLN